ncbi:MAG: hypothetical protein ACTHXX_12730 [Staphylococcus equorum]
MTRSRINVNETAKKFLSEEKKEEKSAKSNGEKKAETKATRPNIKNGKYKQRPYYISDEHYQSIRLLSVYRDTDTSSIVREALTDYLKKHQEELNK